MTPGLKPLLMALALTGTAFAQEATPVPAVIAPAAAAPTVPAPAQVPDETPLCAICWRVTGIQTETRPGKTTGMGAATGAMVGGVIGRKMGCLLYTSDAADE